MDENRDNQCRVVINASPLVIDSGSVALNVNGKYYEAIYVLYVHGHLLCTVVPTPDVSIVPNSPITGALVGSPQDIQCRIDTVDGVEFSSVTNSWTGS